MAQGANSITEGGWGPLAPPGSGVGWGELSCLVVVLRPKGRTPCGREANFCVSAPPPRGHQTTLGLPLARTATDSLSSVPGCEPAQPPGARPEQPPRDLQLVAFEGLLDRKLIRGGEWGCISSVEVMMRPPEVFVRPLLHEEAVRLKRLSKRAKHQCTRQRAAVLLASNVRMTAPQIAAMWRTDPSWVRKVIHEFNERGMDSLRPRYRGGRPRRITTEQRQQIVSRGRCPSRQSRGRR